MTQWARCGRTLALTLTILVSFLSVPPARARGMNPFQTMTSAVVTAQVPETVSTSAGILNPAGTVDRTCNLGSLPPMRRLPSATPDKYRPEDPNAAKVADASSANPGASDKPELIARPYDLSDYLLPNDLEERLGGCGILRDHIVWETPTGDRIAYPEWDEEKKQRLNDIFQMIARGDSDLGLSCPEPARAVPRDRGRMYLSAEEAFDVFAAHVAHALYLEASHGVPWSIAQSTPGELDQLLASYNYQAIIVPSAETTYPDHIRPERDYQQTTASDGTWALLCDPRVGFRFLTGASRDHRYQRENLLGATETDTLFKITNFLRKNLAHGGGETREQLLARSTLTGRLRLEAGGMIWATAGCHGAAQLFQDLARSVNIPLLNVGTQTDQDTGSHYGNRTHRGLLWEWESSRTRVLWHADDIYANAYWDPIFPVDAAGNALSREAADRLFFDTHWTTPRNLQDRGFVYRPQMVYPEIGFGATSRGRFEDYADFGWMGGYWLRSDRLDEYFAHGGGWDETSLSYAYDLSEMFGLEKGYELCSYDLMQYAGNRGGFEYYVGIHFEGQTRSGLAGLQHHTMDEYWDRAQVCAAAYGGIDAVRARYTTWQDERGF